MPTDFTPSQAEHLAEAFLSRVWNGAANDLSAIDELMTVNRHGVTTPIGEGSRP
jgi:hypothetical protein